VDIELSFCVRKPKVSDQFSHDLPLDELRAFSGHLSLFLPFVYQPLDVRLTTARSLFCSCMRTGTVESWLVL